jgi:hypothetical protein
MSALEQGARQLPLRHISIRVPWNDTNWSGVICQKPGESISCLILPRIRASRKDVYWHFRRLALDRQTGAECISKEDGYLYRVREDRTICRVLDGMEEETIDSIPLKLPAGAQIMTGMRWGFRMPISAFYQQIIGPSGVKRGNQDDVGQEPGLARRESAHPTLQQADQTGEKHETAKEQQHY